MALQADRCEGIYTDTAPRGTLELLFQRLPEELRTGDVLIFWKLEQLGQSGAGFSSLTKAIDTTTPAGP